MPCLLAQSAVVPQVFGLDVEGLKPSESATIDHTVFGAPLVSTADLPPGDYDIQVRRPCLHAERD